MGPVTNQKKKGDIIIIDIEKVIKMNMEIKINNNKAEVYTPYNSDFVKRIKQIDGRRWDRSNGCWTVPVESVNIVREIMMDVFGMCDLPAKTIKLRINVKEELSERCGDVNLFGKCLCHAWGRDSGGKAGSGVSYVKGKPGSGGSAKNWCSIVPEGCEIVLTDVPETLYEKEKDDERIEIQIVNDEVDREKLLSERENLLKRLEEINELLGK